MANIPGWSSIPGGDPIRNMTIGAPEGRLLTDDWGSKFIIEGDITLAAVAVLRHVTSRDVYGTLSSAYDPVLQRITRLQFSRFEFDFENGIEVNILPHKESAETSLLLEEMRRILKLKAFL
jgi:hypothetical protein